MTSDQKMVAMIGIGLVILAALTIYRPYLHAVFFTPGDASGASGTGGSTSGSSAKTALAKKVVGPPNTGPGGISSPQMFPGLSKKISHYLP